MKFSSALFALSSALLAPASAQTVVDVAVGSEAHTTLVDLVTQAELVELLSGEGPFTVFAPTNDAFAALGDIKYTQPEWKMHLEDILKYHVVGGASVMAADLTQDQVVGMANGGDATITSLDPPMINEANIVTTDLAATNGVVHVTDGVLLPTSVTSNIVDIVASPAGAQFSTLLAAVTAADLGETLAGEGPFTVFAPTDEAFAAVDEDVLAYLLTPEGKDDLVKVLTYHVYPGVIYQVDVADTTITMLSEDTADVTASPSIAGANIVQGEILASNGVIHVIDAVILPPSLVLPDPLPVAEEPEAEETTDDSAATTMGAFAALASAAIAAMAL